MADFSTNYGGGGFGQDASQGGGFNSEGNGSQKQGQATHQSLTPVTIKQINDAVQPIPDGVFQIHNVELNMVSFVGVVRKVGPLSNLVSITVEDGTGTIEVKKWVGEDSSIEEETEHYTSFLNQYVTVSGALKLFQETRSVQNATIQLVEDHNQVIYHNLSAISIHLKAQGIKPSANKQQNTLFVSEDANTQSNSINDRVLDFIKANTPKMNEGIPTSYIARELGFPSDSVLNVCLELQDQGSIYAGADESSFLSL